MRFTTAFIALLALTPALCAPVPPTEPNTVEALVASAKGNPTSLLEKMGPIAKEIETLINSMAHPTGADAPKAPVTPPSTPAAKPDAPAGAPAPAPAEPKAADPAAASEPAANPEPATPTTDAAGGAAGAAEGAEAAPTDAPAGTVQRRDVDPAAAAQPEPTEPASTAESAPAPTAPAPSAPVPTVSAPTTPVAATSTPTTELKPKDVYKLRMLLQKATMYQQAVEQVLLAKGKNIEERPTSKTPAGVAWGIANGPIMAVLGLSGMVQKQPS